MAVQPLGGFGAEHAGEGACRWGMVLMLLVCWSLDAFEFRIRYLCVLMLSVSHYMYGIFCCLIAVTVS
jgi:hypothetical protein